MLEGWEQKMGVDLVQDSLSLLCLARQVAYMESSFVFSDINVQGSVTARARRFVAGQRTFSPCIASSMTTQADQREGA